MRGTPIDVRTGTLALTAAVLLTACDGTDQAVAPPPAPSAKPTTPTPTPTPTPTRRKLKPGAKGADVEALQRRLKALRYDPGKVDGKYGPSTQMAVWAFQAVHRMKQKSTLDTPFWKALDNPRRPRPMAKKREKNRVDVDLKRQYLVLYEDGRPRLITHVSSGSGEYYCAKDRGAKVPRCRYAVTGTGDFRTGRRFSGWETSPLGRLYNPVYFNGGIAFHGALDVPRYPASHGCVRMPMHIAEYFPDLLGTNVPVHVRRPR
ncbi:murein L,D-transpeptidase [Actinomadura spongiicola]|uniref:Murein L,D-transpeptidase n=1 Tax=Actinomadura spongiicola TaxID=2303421 RepID=A0A372GJ47_9ACTN|nr:L,D-transpeptidase family protein [Actinomadura spongiicola]RFS85384.1 murein L,D-transpeptidase [Actinomadura spongiicola]